MTSAGISTRDAATPDGMRLYAIGDVHGRFDLLQQMHQLIAVEIMRDQPQDWRVIHLGDYVDRGPQSAQVLDLLAKLVARDPRYIALMGNHDEGMLEFLTDPTAEGARIFLNYGGVETAASYGVALDAQDPYDLIWIRRAFLDHAGLFEKVVVHGHTPHDQPQLLPNRINIDTMAFSTGRLTALVMDGREKRFLVAEGGRE